MTTTPKPAVDPDTLEAIRAQFVTRFRDGEFAHWEWTPFLEGATWAILNGVVLGDAAPQGPLFPSVECEDSQAHALPATRNEPPPMPRCRPHEEKA